MKFDSNREDYVPENHHRIGEERRLWEEIWALTDPYHVHREKTPENATECFERWLCETRIGLDAKGRRREDYICLEEVRPKGEVRYHVLVDDWAAKGDDSLRLWKEITGGWAFSREIRSGGRSE